MSQANLRVNVERWLIHENYNFEEIKTTENNFKMVIKDSVSIPIEIFEPKKQPGMLVLGGKFALKNKQMSRFFNSILARNRITGEDGKLVIGVYLVLDKVETFTQQILMDAILQVIEMSEKTMRFIMKTF